MDRESSAWFQSDPGEVAPVWEPADIDSLATRKRQFTVFVENSGGPFMTARY
jgi:hypothetical protein